ENIRCDQVAVHEALAVEPADGPGQRLDARALARRRLALAQPRREKLRQRPKTAQLAGGEDRRRVKLCRGKGETLAPETKTLRGPEYIFDRAEARRAV